MSVPSTLENRSSVTTTCGLSSAKSREVALDLEQRPLDACARRLGARRLLAEPRRVRSGWSRRRGSRLHDDVAHRDAGRAGRGEQVHRADDVDLVQSRARSCGWSRRRGTCARSCRPGWPSRCGRGSSSSGRRARTRCARARRLGSSVSRPTITSTSGSASSAWATRPPQKVPRPVTRTRLPIAQPNQTTAALAQHVVERLLDPDADVVGLVHDPALRVALLVGRHVEVHGSSTRSLNLAGKCRTRAEHGPKTSMLAVIGK